MELYNPNAKRKRAASASVQASSSDVSRKRRTIQVDKSPKQVGEPEKVIADAEFFLLMQTKNLKISDIAAAASQSGNMTLYATSCTIAKLAVQENISTALQFAMDARELGCGHGDSGLSSVDCITDYVHDATYIVATPSRILRENLKMICGIRFMKVEGLEGGYVSLEDSSHQENKPSSFGRTRDGHTSAEHSAAFDGIVSRKIGKKDRMLEKEYDEEIIGRFKDEMLEKEEDDEEIIGRFFQKMRKKMIKSRDMMMSEHSYTKTTKISGDIQYFVDLHKYVRPLNVIYDNAFLRLYMLPHRETVVQNLQKLLGGPFVFCHTDCVYRKIHQNHLFDLMIDLPTSLYHCRHSDGFLRSDFDCLRDLVEEKGLGDSLVLATGNFKLHGLVRAISGVPIIFLGDMDHFELHFEGQTAAREKIVPVKQEPKVNKQEHPSKTIEIPNGKEYVVAGEAWLTTRHNVESESGALIDVQRDPPLASLKLRGSPDAIAKAEHMIQKILIEAPAGRIVGVETKESAMQIPAKMVGLIIGKGGETIKYMQARTGASMQVTPLHVPPGDTWTKRFVKIVGTQKQIEAATQLVEECIEAAPKKKKNNKKGQELEDYFDSKFN